VVFSGFVLTSRRQILLSYQLASAVRSVYLTVIFLVSSCHTTSQFSIWPICDGESSILKLADVATCFSVKAYPLDASHTTMPSSLLSVFILPLVAILGFPHIYKLLTHGSYSLYEEQQLQEVASLMDSIYTTLANMTFIPHVSINHGPHTINTSDIKCKASSSVIRLMELLPYVDSSLVQTPDWIFGGVFIDYRRSDHLKYSICDPLRGESFGWTDYMTPTTIALTDWGTGGWNGDRTWVMLYDTDLQAISTYDGEMWVNQGASQRVFGAHLPEITGNQWGTVRDLGASFSAPETLRTIRDNFLTLKWIPWETSYKENGFGVQPDQIKKLLLQNGWPRSFSADQFNADFIRTKHKPSGRGYARHADRRIKLLGPHSGGELEWYQKGDIAERIEHLARIKAALKAAKEDDDKAMQEWRLRSTTFDLEQDYADLQAAEEDVNHLCPDGVCVAPRDLILWEYRSLERAYEKSFHANHTSECTNRLSELLKHMPPDPSRFNSCLDQVALENRWLHLAYTQSKAEALEHCAATGSELLPPDNVENRAKAKIAMLESEIARGENRLKKMEAWRQLVPEDAKRTRKVTEMHEDSFKERNRKFRARIEWIEKELTQGGMELWDWLDDEERMVYDD
jgi:hypothetical protein